MASGAVGVKEKETQVRRAGRKRKVLEPGHGNGLRHRG